MQSRKDTHAINVAKARAEQTEAYASCAIAKASKAITEVEEAVLDAIDAELYLAVLENAAINTLRERQFTEKS